MRQNIKRLLILGLVTSMLFGFTPKTTQAKVTSKARSIGATTRVTASASNYNIRIKKPASDIVITTTDNYKNKRLVLKVSGNYKSFFKKKSNRYIKKDKYFRYYKVTYSKGYTYIYIRPRKNVIKAYAVSQTSSYIYVKYAAPKTIYKNIVVIDAGHGGSDTGATGNGLREKDLTLSIVLAAKKRFDENSDYKVYYTRTSDTYPSLTARSTLSNRVKADRFISVHINSYKSSSKGTETLYNSKGYKSSSKLTSKTWSRFIHNYVVSATGFTNRGLVNRTGLAVLRNTKTASTLTEIGFISNTEEATSMAANTDNYGNAIYNAIINSFSTYPSKR